MGWGADARARDDGRPRPAGPDAGFLTTGEISLALDELGLEPAEVDEFYDSLEELQIDVVDEPGVPEPELDLEVGVREMTTDSLQLFLKDIGKVPLLDRRAGGRALEADRAR